MSDGVLGRGLQPVARLARSIAGINGLFEKHAYVQTVRDAVRARLTRIKLPASEVPGILAELRAILGQLDTINGQIDASNSRLDVINRRLELLECHSHSPPNCPVCARQGPFRQVGTNVLRNGVPTPVFECSHCTHKFVYSVPSPTVQLSWYQGIEYHVADRAYQGINSPELNEQWSTYLSGRTAPLEQDVLDRFGLSGKLRIGEFGCGEGALLKHLALKGHWVVGFEAGTEIAKQGAEEYGIEIEPGDFELSETHGRNLDVIMSFHTLEHVLEPASVVAHAAAMLRPGGCILIEVPCDDREMDTPDHLHFFSERSLTYALRKHFNHLKVRPSTYLRDGVAATGSMLISRRKT